MVKSVSFDLERFQKLGVLKNVQLFWATHIDAANQLRDADARDQ